MRSRGSSVDGILKRSLASIRHDLDASTGRVAVGLRHIQVERGLDQQLEHHTLGLRHAERHRRAHHHAVARSRSESSEQIRRKPPAHKMCQEISINNHATPYVSPPSMEYCRGASPESAMILMLPVGMLQLGCVT